jgi:hypothetical protein
MPDGSPPPYTGRFKLSFRGDYDLVPALRWQVRDLLPLGSIMMLFGEPKNGKSYVALSWALSVQIGSPWCSLAVEQADVLYISPEGYFALLRRQDAWEQLNNGGERVPLAYMRDPVNLLEKGDTELAIAALKAQGMRPGFS